jgi:hypothetical protein
MAAMAATGHPARALFRYPDFGDPSADDLTRSKQVASGWLQRASVEPRTALGDHA